MIKCNVVSIVILYMYTLNKILLNRLLISEDPFQKPAAFVAKKSK